MRCNCDICEADWKGVLIILGFLIFTGGLCALVMWGYLDIVNSNKTDWGCENTQNYYISPCMITSLDQTTAELLLGEQWQHKTNVNPPTLHLDDSCNIDPQNSIA
eukprot:304196_1